MTLNWLHHRHVLADSGKTASTIIPAARSKLRGNTEKSKFLDSGSLLAERPE